MYLHKMSKIKYKILKAKIISTLHCINTLRPTLHKFEPEMLRK